MLTTIRIDKWLWTIRIYKSRTLATDACNKGKIIINEKIAKPADHIEQGNIVKIKKDKINFTFKVKALIPNRVSATLASACYENLTPEEEMNKWKIIGESSFYFHSKNRPTKKDRRELEEFFNSMNPEDLKN